MKLFIVAALLLMVIGLTAQTGLTINGINEAKFTYRTAEDSLNAYFYDSFAFNLAYRNFNFGMKFIAELPKQGVQQGELLDELNPNSLNLGWRELYASFSKDAYTIHAGTTEETFGNGIVFRSYQDPEFDEDHRIESFLVKYDSKLKIKALYGAIKSPDYASLYDLSYGVDAQYPLVSGVNIGGSAIAFRNLITESRYSQMDVFGTRLGIATGGIDIQAEYAHSELFHLPGIASVFGKAIYTNGSYAIGSLSIGGAYKYYENFLYRLHDLPVANYHNETLSDAQATGNDEEGFQGFGSYALTECLSVYLDYAEAWNKSKQRKMNDAYAAADWIKDGKAITLSYGQIEKVDNGSKAWQQEMIPGIAAAFPIAGKTVQLHGEYKLVEKQHVDIVQKYAEPKLQADFAISKLSLALGAQSRWEESIGIMDSRYYPFVEAKYPLAPHTDITLFAGKEAGGKVCRNGVCRYVASFEGIKAELTTRF